MAKPLPVQAAAETTWRDLREWLARVDKLGELKRVTGANSEEDIGAITEMLDHAEGSPCVLFDEIANFKPGYRVLVNSMGSTKRQAVILGSALKKGPIYDIVMGNQLFITLDSRLQAITTEAAGGAIEAVLESSAKNIIYK